MKTLKNKPFTRNILAGFAFLFYFLPSGAETGSFTMYSSTNRTLSSYSEVTINLSPSDPLPANAVITDIEINYINVDDNGDPYTFYPYYTKIYLSSDSHSSDEYFYLYGEFGDPTAHHDDGYDSDSYSDSDVFITNWNYTIFNGEPASQDIQVTIQNDYSGEALIDHVGVKVYWETRLPNLRADHTPNSWSNPIVINHTLNSKADADILFAGTPTYFNLNYRNEDADIPSTTGFPFFFMIDGELKEGWDRIGADADKSYTFTNRTYTLSEGEHTICQRVDLMGVTESDESDNVYCRTLSWVGAPSAPTLSSPTNSSECQNTNIILTWISSSNAISYQLQVDDDDDFFDPVFDISGISSPQETVLGLDKNKTYYWRVRASNPSGTSPWSGKYHFKTAPEQPSTPALTLPDEGVTCQSTTITLDWNSSANAGNYDLQVDNNLDFSSPEINQTGIAGTQKEVSGLSQGTTYFWRVRGVNSCDNLSPWSSSREFSTKPNGPDLPELISPSNDANCQPLNVSVSWNNTTGATSYTLQVDDEVGFLTPEFEQSAISATSQELSGLEPGKTYHWRVQANGECGTYSYWASKTFSTASSSPGKPIASAPADEATCQELSLDLEWNESENASSYSLELDDNDDFSSPIIQENNIASTSFEASGLNEGTIYYWRTKSVNDCGASGDWSSVNNFSTTGASPNLPELLIPADKADCQATAPTLNWNNVVNATSFTVEVDDNDDFSSPEYTSTCNDVTHNCTALNENTMYFWRVSASADCGQVSGWSTSQSFTTGSNGMNAPQLVQPEDNATKLENEVSLSWSSTEDITEYQLQVDDNQDFSSPEYNIDQQLSELEISDLKDGTIYYWHVRALDLCSTSDWSETRQFSIGEVSPTDVLTLHSEKGYAISQNYPNPFHKSTSIDFTLPEGTQVRLEFFDLHGRQVYWLSEQYPKGIHTIRPQFREDLSPGIYFYRISTKNYIKVKQCVVISF